MSKPINQYHINEEYIQEEFAKLKAKETRKFVKYNRNNPNLKVITVNIPILDLAWMHLFKDMGLTRSITEYIRRSVRDRVLNEARTIEFQMKALHNMKKNVDVSFERLE